MDDPNIMIGKIGKRKGVRANLNWKAYKNRGTETSEFQNIKDALRPLQTLFGTEPAREIGPKRLKLVRENMIASGLSRSGINARIGRIVRMFRWAASEELIPPEVYHGLKTVPVSNAVEQSQERQPRSGRLPMRSLTRSAIIARNRSGLWSNSND